MIDRSPTDDGWVEPVRMTAEIPKDDLRDLLKACRRAHPRLVPRVPK